VENTLRSGSDRRKESLPVEHDRRSGSDRRVIINRIEQYLGILDKIPAFRNLSVEQFKKLLSISSTRVLSATNPLCREGDVSDALYVLIKGKLAVLLPDGKEIGRVEPVTIVGEMGVLTDSPRSATVIAREDSILLVIGRNELTLMFRTEPDLCRTLLLNVIAELSGKVRHLNELFDNLTRIHILD